MTYAFDSLGYAKRLRDAGVTSEQAEAHAEAAREFIMTESCPRACPGDQVTKSDLVTLETILRQEMALGFQKVDARFQQTEARFGARFQELQTAIDNLTLRMTVRLGGMIAVAVAVLAAINKL